MRGLLDVPLNSVIALSVERAVLVVRAILRAECHYAKVSPAALTISAEISVADGGVDAQIDVPIDGVLPSDCIFRSGLTGIQIKSGTTFKPWTLASLRRELLNRVGKLPAEVERLLREQGRYTLFCTGHDLTPERRNKARRAMAAVFNAASFSVDEDRIEVLGASQIAEFAERYPGIASLLVEDPIREALVLNEWARDVHMANTLEPAAEQSELIDRIRLALTGDMPHVRILGEPGLGKTRLVLEALKHQDFAPYVLYVRDGTLFGQTALFRRLLKTDYTKLLVLVIDELPETEMADIWRHLKPRSGSLKIVSLDHGRDETYDDAILRLTAPRLPDEAIQGILVANVGPSHELERWVAICEGSPRVAQAVADNLRANPGDILRPPATVPIWARFLHGYGRRDESTARQIDCVTRHLALFSRFGYESPVEGEAVYVADFIHTMDPTIGVARFQEIVRHLRDRRVLQGSRTLFFVPKALHIYLWKQFWESYGRGFDFAEILNGMPETLHAWFMSMFKYAGDVASSHVIDDILRPDGMFARHEWLTSDKGSRFLSILAEANAQAVLQLLEATLGTWSDDELLSFAENRQHIVWTLEKIAVWRTLTVRAIGLLGRLAANETAAHSNNATGTLVGLFCIGPEAAITESTPQERLPALLALLRSANDVVRRLGLKAMDAALNSYGTGVRIVGPEYQGLRERAKLSMPSTYDEWWDAKHLYFKALVAEALSWPDHLHTELSDALLNAVNQQIRSPPCTDLAFEILDRLVADERFPPSKLNHFFSHWQVYEEEDKHPAITKRLRNIERYYSQRDISSRFQRYVIDASWHEWDETTDTGVQKYRIRALLRGLARRVARRQELFASIRTLLAPAGHSFALWHFGAELAEADVERHLLPHVLEATLELKNELCLVGYLSVLWAKDRPLFLRTVENLLELENCAWLGATIALRSEYDEHTFLLCLDALERNWIPPALFGILRYGKALDSVPLAQTGRLLTQLKARGDSLTLLMGFLESIPFDDTSPFTPEFVFEAICDALPSEELGGSAHGYQWKNVCIKWAAWSPDRRLALLDVLFVAMGRKYRLSYDQNIQPLADELLRADPEAAWQLIAKHFEATLPKWRSDLLCWLKGGLHSFDERGRKGAVADLPISKVLSWIDQDVEPRAVLMAHATPGTLDIAQGGALTLELLRLYGQLEGVRNGIGAAFNSGGWSGPTSAYLKRKREKLRVWLAAGFDAVVTAWIERELEHLDKSIERELIEEERSRFE